MAANEDSGSSEGGKTKKKFACLLARPLARSINEKHKQTQTQSEMWGAKGQAEMARLHTVAKRVQLPAGIYTPCGSARSAPQGAKQQPQAGAGTARRMLHVS